jgi:hypothetical protein
MKSKVRILMIFLLAVTLLLASTIPASANIKRTSFTGTEVWVEDVSPGVETYPDEGLYHVRGAVSRFTMAWEARTWSSSTGISSWLTRPSL